MAYPPEKPVSGQPVAEAYKALVAKSNLESDPAQHKLAGLLDNLLTALDKKRLANKSSALGWLFGKSAPDAEQTRGIYIWGSVGRGKSMLMDLFFENAVHIKKRRVHFNDFMVDVHDRIHQHRKEYDAGRTSTKDPLAPIARDIARQTDLFCFDEFTVTDIADAMILGRLFSELFKQSVTIVATSNVPPDDLYRDGLNRSTFLPFIKILKNNITIFELDARTDYRLEKLSHAPVYLSPLNSRAKAAMDEAWLRLTGSVGGNEREITVKGRILLVPEANRGVARFSFSQLCEEPRAAADYLALTREFHTIFIDEIRIIQPSERNVAKRLILMIDTFYDNKIKLVVSAQASPNALYQASSGTEAFEFERTASRLIEMQSLDYLGGGNREVAT